MIGNPVARHIAALLAFTVPAAAFAAQETMTVETVEYQSPAELRAPPRPEQKIALTGRWTVPDDPSRKHPAVVVMHSAGGIGPAENEIASRLAGQGYAVLLLNRYAGRRTSNGDSLLGLIADSYAALKTVAADSRIDSKRIAIAGVSAGGMNALISNSEHLRRIMVEGDLKYAAHVSFYGNWIYTSESSTGAPILMLLGEKDTNAPTRQCEEIAALHRAAGTNPRVAI